MEKGISLACINVEMFRHVERVSAFLAQAQPEVVCFQEVIEEDLPRFAASFGAEHFRFEPMTKQWTEGRTPVIGVGIASRLPVSEWRSDLYAGEPGAVPYSDSREKETFLDKHHMVLSADVQKGDSTYRIATTHFTWTPDGNPTDYQRNCMHTLLDVLSQLGEFTLCGDFNAPRFSRDGTPGEIFNALAAVYKDNIPATYVTSLDGSLHRAGPIPLMVDGLFTTPGYSASDVELHTGVSDHCAITASIHTALPR